MQTLGDPHNFGQCVARRADGRIVKPRSVFWEWLILDPSSPARKTIHAVFLKDGISPYDLIPSLTYSADERHGDLTKSGDVTPLVLATSDVGPLTKDDSYGAGLVAGLIAWWGITDLHRENIFSGRTANGSLVICPIDIEAILHDFMLLSQTILLPAPGVPAPIAGFAGVLEGFGNFGETHLELCRGYVDAIDQLEQLSQTLLEIVMNLPQWSHAPSRLIFRPTREYAAYLRKERGSESFQPPLDKAELQQLERGDVPYFFRTVDSSEVRMFREDGASIPVHMPADLTDKDLRFCRPFSAFQRERRHLPSLRKAGVLQLLAASKRGLIGTASSCGMRVDLTEEKMQLIYKDLRLESQRDRR